MLLAVSEGILIIRMHLWKSNTNSLTQPANENVASGTASDTGVMYSAYTAWSSNHPRILTNIQAMEKHCSHAHIAASQLAISVAPSIKGNRRSKATRHFGMEQHGSASKHARQVTNESQDHSSRLIAFRSGQIFHYGQAADFQDSNLRHAFVNPQAIFKIAAGSSQQ